MAGGAPYTQESHGGWTPPSPATGCGAISFAPPVESSPVRHIRKKKPWRNPLKEQDVSEALEPMRRGKGRLQDTQRRLTRLAFRLVAHAMACNNSKVALETAFRLIEANRPVKRGSGAQSKGDAIREVQNALARFTAQSTE